mmetsp:Transcript_20849/g.18469  ORF Transcript_20849/g.18469 Transcript_20849/m.18469 type:complete len:113 (-) Transcript_20849:306-644(-)
MRRKTKQENESYKKIPVESSASIIVSESPLANGRKLYDNWQFLERHPLARLIEVTVHGYNYITAIETKFEVPGEDEIFTFLHQGGMHEMGKKLETKEHKLCLDTNEQIETVN